MAKGDLYNKNNQKVGSVDIDIEGAISSYYEKKDRAYMAELNFIERGLRSYLKILEKSKKSEEQLEIEAKMKEIEAKIKKNFENFYKKFSESDKILYNELINYKIEVSPVNKKLEKDFKVLYLAFLVLTIILFFALTINDVITKWLIIGTMAVTSFVFEILYRITKRKNNKAKAYIKQEEDRWELQKKDFIDRNIELFDFTELTNEYGSIHPDRIRRIIYETVWRYSYVQIL